MNKVEIFYKKVIEAVCKECGTDPVMMFSNNKERNVDARGVAITILADRKLSDNIISDLTGMTRQAVNRMRNLYPDRIRRSYYLRRTVGERQRGAIRYGLRVRYVVRHVICL